VARVAAEYEKGKNSGFQAFECASMTPTMFKAQLQNNFGINLTPSELKALMDYFDKFF